MRTQDSSILISPSPLANRQKGLLESFSTSHSAFCVKKMAAKKNVENFWCSANAKRWVPFVTRETSSGQHVRQLVFGVHIFDLDLGDLS